MRLSPVGIIAFLVFAYLNITEIEETAAGLDERLLNPYLELIKSEQYEAAYNSLGPSLREIITSEEFLQAHKNRRSEMGPPTKWERGQTYQVSDLFSDENRMGIKYYLMFEKGGDGHALYYVDMNIEPFRIVEIHGATGASDKLNNEIW